MEKPLKESKANRFRRVAEARTNKVLDMIRLLGNCADRRIYEFTEDQIKQIFCAITVAVNRAESLYRNSVIHHKKRFSLSDNDIPPSPAFMDEIQKPQILPLSDSANSDAEPTEETANSKKELKASITLSLSIREGETEEQAADRLYDLLYEGLCMNANHCCEFWIESTSATE
jgi:hypothetical protein